MIWIGLGIAFAGYCIAWGFYSLGDKIDDAVRYWRDGE